ncbi:hypothetical protein BTO06_00965 [Tenacibaculum sp. SZ-18]|uniref:hypothetical protein n=1 Tax=Tenacibaculum sp. SZ-18 TaxID=754423 RepID=UPI000C2D4417|nr:hypothetical protein [Tenacibaculum sp. SZ-18]AUC13804.1 hypothetical protein BTO06_00965 [Tenacibaculum sp. SZ-18]
MLTIEEKIDLVISLCEKHDITAYEIGKETSVSKSAARNILNKTQSNPKNKTLNIILEYIEEKIVGSQAQIELKPEIAEEHRNAAKRNFETHIPQEVDFDSLSIENKLKTIYFQNQKILAMDDKLEQVAQALSILLLDTDAIKDKLGIEDEVKNQLKNNF